MKTGLDHIVINHLAGLIHQYHNQSTEWKRGAVKARILLYCKHKELDKESVDITLDALASSSSSQVSPKKYLIDPEKSKSEPIATIRKCLQCGKNISDKKHTAKFCSSLCRVTHNRK